METETSQSLADDLRIFGVAFLMMTPDGAMKRLPPEVVRLAIDAFKKAQSDSASGDPT